MVCDQIRFIEQKVEIRSPSHFLLKDPIACMSSEYLHREFEMDVVIIIRHPAAFVSSLQKMGRLLISTFCSINRI